MLHINNISLLIISNFTINCISLCKSHFLLLITIYIFYRYFVYANYYQLNAWNKSRDLFYFILFVHSLFFFTFSIFIQYNYIFSLLVLKLYYFLGQFIKNIYYVISDWPQFMQNGVQPKWSSKKSYHYEKFEFRGKKLS